MVIGCEPIPITVIKLLFRLFVFGISFGYRKPSRKPRYVTLHFILHVFDKIFCAFGVKEIAESGFSLWL